MIKTLEEIKLPEFTADHIRFFKECKELTQSDRLALDPGSLDYKTYMLQYTSLVATEENYDWLVAIYEVQEAEKQQERMTNAGYTTKEQRDPEVNKGFSEKEINSII